MSTTKYDDVQRSLQNLKDEPLCSENQAAIEYFVNVMASEGTGESQQIRLLYSWKTMLKKFAPDDFRIRGASEDELKTTVARVNRSDYAESSKEKFRSAIKRFYKIENDSHEYPEKVKFFKVQRSSKQSSVTREDLFTDDELKRLLRNLGSTRDRAIIKTLYESAARPGELLNCSIADFTTNGKGDFIFLEGLKQTPDRTNQLVRAGRTLHEWLAQHPLGGEIGDIQDQTAPLWVKTEQQECQHCGDIPYRHSDSCDYERDLADSLDYDAFRRRFKIACRQADIPESKRRPYNLRHTRLTEVATFMGYEQLNKFAGWKPGSDRAKVYVHLNNDDVNRAIRNQYGLDSNEGEQQNITCPFCSCENQYGQTECRRYGRPLSLKQKIQQEEKQDTLERLAELEKRGVLDQLEKLERLKGSA